MNVESKSSSCPPIQRIESADELPCGQCVQTVPNMGSGWDIGRSSHAVRASGLNVHQEVHRLRRPDKRLLRCRRLENGNEFTYRSTSADNMYCLVKYCISCCPHRRLFSVYNTCRLTSIKPQIKSYKLAVLHPFFRRYSANQQAQQIEGKERAKRGAKRGSSLDASQSIVRLVSPLLLNTTLTMTCSMTTSPPMLSVQ